MTTICRRQLKSKQEREQWCQCVDLLVRFAWPWFTLNFRSLSHSVLSDFVVVFLVLLHILVYGFMADLLYKKYFCKILNEY